MRMLIRIVFVIFIAKGIDCFGSVCDDFCGWYDRFKDKDENKKIAISLVDKYWYNAKKENFVLFIIFLY